MARIVVLSDIHLSPTHGCSTATTATTVSAADSATISSAADGAPIGLTAASATTV